MDGGDRLGPAESSVWAGHLRGARSRRRCAPGSAGAVVRTDWHSGVDHWL